MEAYDHRALDASAKEIVDHAKRTNARVCGPIPMPTRIERYTVLRSPHIDKKSREQFEMRTHKRVIDIFEPTARTDRSAQPPGRSGRCVREDQGLTFSPYKHAPAERGIFDCRTAGFIQEPVRPKGTVRESAIFFCRS